MMMTSLARDEFWHWGILAGMAAGKDGRPLVAYMFEDAPIKRIEWFGGVPR
jgi:hypothetical protein